MVRAAIGNPHAVSVGVLILVIFSVIAYFNIPVQLKPTLEPLKDYAVAGAGDYYQIPFKSGQPAVLEPYLYRAGDRNVLMTADVIASVKVNDWVFYGQIGRELETDNRTFQPKHVLDSNEYWAGYQPAEGIGFRAGRFLPAYGIRFSDHTSYNRMLLGLAQYDQIYGVEVSHTRGRYLTQVSLGPGRAESVIDDDGRSAFTATGRFQVDLGSRTSIAASGLFRAESDDEPALGSAGVAFGYAPGSRLTTWTQVDAQYRDGSGDVVRGLSGHLGDRDAAGQTGRRARGAGSAALRRRHGAAAAHAFQRQPALLPRSQPDDGHHNPEGPGAASPVSVMTSMPPA